MILQSERDESFLESLGWTVECQSPLEIRHEDGSFATGQASKLVLAMLRMDVDESAAVLSPNPLVELVALIDQVDALQLAAAKQPDTAYGRWKHCFNFVFSENCSRRIGALLEQLNMELSYCDPDMDYEDDVRAYGDALKQLKSDIEPFLAALAPKPSAT